MDTHIHTCTMGVFFPPPKRRLVPLYLHIELVFGMLLTDKMLLVCQAATKHQSNNLLGGTKSVMQDGNKTDIKKKKGGS